MTGRKTLGEVRAELEAALGTGPPGESPVAESLRRFLAAGARKGGIPTPPPAPALPPTKGAGRGRPKGLVPQPPPAAERDR